jgi:EF-hand domain pair
VSKHLTDTMDTTNVPGKTFNGYSLLTRTKAFRKLTKWAFTICDTKKDGAIGKAELYSGILLVHIQLAKYTGVAACYPPTFQVVSDLFDAADDDQSGTVDENEFEQILIICCGQITSRIVVYYTIIIMLVPYVADTVIHMLIHFDEILGLGVTQHGSTYTIFQYIEKVLTFGALAQKVTAALLFAILVPKLFDWIDRMSQQAAKATTTTTIVNSHSTTNDMSKSKSSNETKKDD